MVLKELLSFAKRNKAVYCYGSGKLGREVYFFLHNNGVEMAAFIQTDVGDNKNVLGKKVICINEFYDGGGSGVIVSVSKRHIGEIKKEIKRKNIKNVFYLTDEMQKVLDNEIYCNNSNRGNMKKFIMVLLYHQVSEADNCWGTTVSLENFEKQMVYLKENYKIVGFNDDWKGICEPTIVITFDDGYRDNYVNAMPILEKYNIPATFFISTENIGTDRLFWWDKIEYLLKSTDEVVVFNKKYNLKNINKLHELLIKLDHSERMDIINNLYKEKHISMEFESDTVSMSMEELISLGTSPIVTIGAHTVSHMSLNYFNKDVQEYEIKQSKDFLEKIFDTKINIFSYPYGNYNKDSIDILKKIGIKKSATVVAGLADDYDLYEIPRNKVENYSIEDFKRFINKIFALYG